MFLLAKARTVVKFFVFQSQLFNIDPGGIFEKWLQEAC